MKTMNVVKSVKMLKLVKVMKTMEAVMIGKMSKVVKEVTMVKFFGDVCKGGEGVEGGGGDEVVKAVNVAEVKKW